MGIEIGRNERKRRIFLEEKDRTTHMHVIGASGRGKSKFLEYMIRSDIKKGNGVCLIDPHGYLYDDIVKWCASRRYLEDRNIILLDPGSDEWTFGFNPLNFEESDDVAYCVDAMVKACAQVWGGGDMSDTPLLKRCLRATFHALVEKKRSLLESDILTTAIDDKGIRRYLTDTLNDPIFRSQWAMFNAMAERSLSQFEGYFSSTNNRIIEFLASKRIRRIIGQTEQVLDIRKIMDESAILLVNLSSGSTLSDDNARLLGSLLVNDLFLKARRRPPESEPFYLYIDECSLFINDDIARILDEARKFGLHLTLSHQHLAQLKDAGEKIYSSVMTNAQTKVVFGGLTPDDAEVMSQVVFMGEFNLQEAKHSFDKPTVTRYIKRYLRSETTGRSESTARSRGYSWG